MKMKTLATFFKSMTIFLVLLSNASCIDYITDFKIGAVSPKLVLNAMITPDTLIVHLSRNMDIKSKTNYDEIFITNATVTLFENGVKKGNLQHTELLIDEYSEKGFYILDDFVPKVGATYKIEAEAKGFPKISAITTIPFLPQSIKIDTLTRINNYELIFEIITEIINNNGQKNYYGFSIPSRLEMYDYTVNCEFSTSTPSLIEFYRNFGTFDIMYIDFDSYYYCDYFFTSDKNLSAKPLNLKFFLNRGNLNYLENEELEFVVDVYSSEYYAHLLSLARIYSSDETGLFSEKVSVYTNVENGLGVFGAKNSYRKLFKIEKQP